MLLLKVLHIPLHTSDTLDALCMRTDFDDCGGAAGFHDCGGAWAVRCVRAQCDDAARKDSDAQRHLPPPTLLRTGSACTCCVHVHKHLHACTPLYTHAGEYMRTLTHIHRRTQCSARTIRETHSCIRARMRARENYVHAHICVNAYAYMHTMHAYVCKSKDI